MIGKLHNLLAGCLIAAILSAAANSQEKGLKPLALPTRNKSIQALSPGELKLLKADGKQSTGVARQAVDKKSYAVLNLEFDDKASCQKFTKDYPHLLTQFEQFADVFVLAEEDAVDAVLNTPGLKWFEIARTGVVPPPAKQPISDDVAKGRPEAIAQGGVGNLKGKGVVIAIIDSGVDFRHPDFIVTDSKGRKQSRLLYLWDTFQNSADSTVGKPAPVKYPGGAAIGTIYSREDLTAELNNTGERKIPDTDTNGHGTACASIAAGSGAAGAKAKSEDGAKLGHIGVAPEADLIAVRIGGEGSGLAHSYLLGAILEWLDRTVGSQPLVVSCSFGGQYGGRDGYLVEERQLNARFAQKSSGRIVCIAAGNDGTRALHAKVKLPAKGEPVRFSWEAPGATEVALYFQTADIENVNYKIAGTAVAELSVLRQNPLTEQFVAKFEAGAGAGEIELTNDGEREILVDGYIVGEVIGDESAQFTGKLVARSEQVAAPGTADAAITVGSYDWNDSFHFKGSLKVIGLLDETDKPMMIGGLSDYSNPGYRRFGKTIKPEIIAPGQWYTAAAPLNRDVKLLRDTSGEYQLFNGTSAATPYVAGVMALLLQKNPKLTSSAAKALLAKSATKPNSQIKLPHQQWGHGKLDLTAIMRLIEATR